MPGKRCTCPNFNPSALSASLRCKNNLPTVRPLCGARNALYQFAGKPAISRNGRNGRSGGTFPCYHLGVLCVLCGYDNKSVLHILLQQAGQQLRVGLIQRHLRPALHPDVDIHHLALRFALCF